MVPIDVIDLDSQKAFDNVPHRRLRLKLRALDTAEGKICWMKDWSKDGLLVIPTGSNSKWIRVKSGMPQGSILGLVSYFWYT
jgi:ribonucleases P/MRP protein subunit RPP40